MGRYCNKCKVYKERVCFGRNQANKDCINHICKDCRNRQRLGYYQANLTHVRQINRKSRKHTKLQRQLKLFNILKKRRCKRCGESNPIMLEFDHINPKHKIMNISVIISRATWPKIYAEIKKCRVLCANCHRLRTARQQKWYKDLKAYL